MKTTILTLAAAAASAMSAYGQIPMGTKLIANVPFTFHQGDKVMPAGRYEVSSGHTSAVTISNRAAKVSAVSVVSRRAAQPSVKGYLSFRCYGESNTCFLREIAAPDSGTAIRIGECKAEREHARSAVTPRVAVIEANTNARAAE